MIGIRARGAGAVAIPTWHPSHHIASLERVAPVEGDAGGRVVHESDRKVGRWVAIVDVYENVWWG